MEMRAMEPTTVMRRRVGAVVVAIAPAVLLTAFSYHPYFDNVTDSHSIAEAAASNTTRWGIAHLGIAIGYALVALAFLATRSYLREAGEDRWSSPALPCIILGTTLFAVLVGMEFAPLAAVESGADAGAVQEKTRPWFIPVLVAGSVSYGLGLVGFATGIVQSGVLRPELARIVAGALVLMALARFVPLAIGPLVMTVAGLVALWLMAHRMWTHPIVRSTTPPRLAPAG
jgi:hypothetical protein